MQLDVSLPDVNGMYTISLTFDESNPVFKTTTLVRTVEKNPHDEGNSSVCAPFEFKQVCSSSFYLLISNLFHLSTLFVRQFEFRQVYIVPVDAVRRCILGFLPCGFSTF